MGSITLASSNLQADGPVIDTALSLTGELMACSIAVESSGHIQVWRAGTALEGWTLISQWQVPQPPAHLAWAWPEFGPLLASSDSRGNVSVWQASLPGTSGNDNMMAGADEEEEPWQLVESFAPSDRPVRHLGFAPPAYGLLLSIGSDDGAVYMFEADQPLLPTKWLLHSNFQAVTPLSRRETGDGSSGGPGVLALSWRTPAAGVDPLVSVGTSRGASIWQYCDSLLKWQCVHQLELSTPNTPVPTLHWAPSLGRPVDLIAAAHSRTVDVLAISGSTADLKVERVASLPHDADVWKVEWSVLGTVLAVSTDDQQVSLWQMDLNGTFKHMANIVGSADV